MTKKQNKKRTKTKRNETKTKKIEMSTKYEDSLLISFRY